LYYEPRGTLYEPHTGNEVPLGTRQVSAYHFPAWLYDKILFVEKKGLWPVLKTARLAEQYDMAIVAGEGYSTEACRVLLANADQSRDYQLFVLHDADPFGYNIARTLREATVRMPGHKAQVIDLGLKLGEALDLGLSLENFTRKKSLPAGLGLTPLEKEHFKGQRVTSKSWLCQRVELNAFSAPDLVEFIRGKLEDAGVRGKVVPPDNHIVYVAGELWDQEIGRFAVEIMDRLMSVDVLTDRCRQLFRENRSAAEVRQWVEASQAKDGSQWWRTAVQKELEGLVAKKEAGIEAVLRQLIREAVVPR
jgi:hypothetical protein